MTQSSTPPTNTQTYLPTKDHVHSPYNSIRIPYPISGEKKEADKSLSLDHQPNSRIQGHSIGVSEDLHHITIQLLPFFLISISTSLLSTVCCVSPVAHYLSSMFITRRLSPVSRLLTVAHRYPISVPAPSKCIYHIIPYHSFDLWWIHSLIRYPLSCVSVVRIRLIDSIRFDLYWFDLIWFEYSPYTHSASILLFTAMVIVHTENV